jgi:Gas vesicle protein
MNSREVSGLGPNASALSLQRAMPPSSMSAPSSLADILERVLDKGIVIAGDIQINLLDIELLTIKLRLLVASVDKAREMGINWWESDPSLSTGAQQLEQENRSLRKRLERLERAAGLPPGGRGGLARWVHPASPRTRCGARSPASRVPTRPGWLKTRASVHAHGQGRCWRTRSSRSC